MHDSCHPYDGVMSHIQFSRTVPPRTRGISHSHVRRDSFMNVTWLILVLWRDSFLCVVSDMTHSYDVTWLIPVCSEWHAATDEKGERDKDSFMCDTWISCVTHEWDRIQPLNESCLQLVMTWPIQDTTHSHVRHDSFIRETWLIHMPNTFKLTLDHTFKIQMLATGWRRPTGCLIFVGQFLQKSPIIDGSYAESDLQLKTSYDWLRQPVYDIPSLWALLWKTNFWILNIFVPLNAEIRESSHAYARVMPCHAYEWVMSPTQRHVTHMHESCLPLNAEIRDWEQDTAWNSGRRNYLKSNALCLQVTFRKRAL